MRQYTKEFSTNTKLAAPVIIGQVGQVAVGIVDNLMVGELGAASLAAVSLGNGIFFVVMSVVLGFSMSITPLTAQFHGEQNREQGGKVASYGLLLCGIIGIFLFGVIKVIQQFVPLFNQPEEVVEIAMPYLNVLATSMIPYALYQGAKQFSDGMSLTKLSMVATMVGNVLNILLNYIFIFGKWGGPELGVTGAGIGTLVSRVVMFLVLYFLIIKKEALKSYLKWPRASQFEWEQIRRLVKLGFSIAMQLLFEFGFFTMSIFMAGSLSINAQAANQIALNVASLTFMVAVGFGVAATIRVGNQLGKKDIPNMIRISRSILLLTAVIQLVFGVLFVFIRHWIPTLYVEEVEVIHIAAQLLFIVALFQLSDGLQVTLLGSLRGLLDVKMPTVILFVAYWVVGFPLMYLLSKVFHLGAFGIWIALFTGLTVSCILLFIRYRYLINKIGE